MSESAGKQFQQSSTTLCETPADYIVETYFVLRVVIAVGALLLPVGLLLWGSVDPSVSMQDSISAFYYTPARGLFVGVVVAIGVALMAYRGYTRGENLLLNGAGALAIVVALVPTVDPALPAQNAGNVLHAVAALAFFILAALSIVFYGHETVSDLPGRLLQQRYRAVYRALTVMVLVLPVIAFLMAWAVEPSITLFVVETAALFAFATFWLVKTYELARSHVDMKLV